MLPCASFRHYLGALLPLLTLVACAAGGADPNGDAGGASGSAASSGTGGTAGSGGSSGTAGTAAGGAAGDTSGVGGIGGSSGGTAGSAGGCVGTTKDAEVKRLPVDIIWMVDNSGSMEDAITAVQAGLNAFAAKIATSDIDYKVIMLSKRGTAPTGGLFPICIPTPLASANCGNSDRFFHADFTGDGIKSTQLLEQFIGTLGQTEGYAQGDARGAEPWKEQLRPEASKTMVFVTDDNSRFTADQFLHFGGGQNPFNSATLPAGILDPFWSGLFDTWIAHGIYGWGSETDSNVTCTGGDIVPAASGATYTDLIKMSGGSRAKLCDGAGAWNTFFDKVATAVVATAPIECTLDVPNPPNGETLKPKFVNVIITSDTGTDGKKELINVNLPDQPTKHDCTAGGWYYDNADTPTTITLCPTSCTELNSATVVMTHSIDVQFGCATTIQ